MRRIKIPLTDITSTVRFWANYIAMDSDGEWYEYEEKPVLEEILWARASHGSARQIKESNGLATKTPELLNLLDWKQSLFKVEDVLCQR